MRHTAAADDGAAALQPPERAVARAIRALPSLPCCVGSGAQAAGFRALAVALARTLEGWQRRWAREPAMDHFLNKRSFAHEMEEVLLPLRVLQLVAEAGGAAAGAGAGAGVGAGVRAGAGAGAGVTVVDLCAGKGFLAMCLAHGALPPGAVRRVVMLEKQAVNWSHLPAAEAEARVNGRQDLPPVEIWQRCNVFDEVLLPRLAALEGPLIIVGIHLCKRLAARAIELHNLLGVKSTGLILAPCCIPLSSGVIKISAPKERAAAAGEADGAAQVHAQVWGSETSSEWNNAVTGVSAAERPSIGHCWNCGGVGHLKPDCDLPPSGLSKGQIRRRRKFGGRRCAALIDTASVVAAPRPFEAWVEALCGGVVTATTAETGVEVEVGVGVEEERPLVVALPTSGAGDGAERDVDAADAPAAKPAYALLNPRGERKLSWILAGVARESWANQ